MHAHQVALRPRPLLRRDAALRVDRAHVALGDRADAARPPKAVGRDAGELAGERTEQERVGRAPRVRQRLEADVVGARRQRSGWRVPSAAYSFTKRVVAADGLQEHRHARQLARGVEVGARARQDRGFPAQPPRGERAVGDRAADHVAARRAVVAHVADAQQARHAQRAQALAFSNRRSCDSSGWR